MALTFAALTATAACADAAPDPRPPPPGDRMVLHRLSPDYPAGANGGPARCQAEMDVLADGTVELVCVRCDAERQPRLFVAAVERVAPLWRFSRAPGAAADRVTIEFPFDVLDDAGRARALPPVTQSHSNCPNTSE